MNNSNMTLLEQAYFDAFIDFLCKMIEKYGNRIGLEELDKGSEKSVQLR